MPTRTKNGEKSGFLNASEFPADETLQSINRFKRFNSPQALIEGSWECMGRLADDLSREGYPSLAEYLRHPTDGGPPLLVTAFGYFLRREVVDDPDLAYELYFDMLWQIGKEQRSGFDGLLQAMTGLGDEFRQALDDAVGELMQLGNRIYRDVLDIKTIVNELKSERHSGMETVVGIMESVQQALEKIDALSGEIKPHHSCSIHSPEEKLLVKQILRQFRELTVEEKEAFPALINGVGKLEVATGAIEEGEKLFCEAEKVAGNASAKAEVLFNSYQAALEQKKWDMALSYLSQSLQLAPDRFRCIPMDNYLPTKILGAGGFGVVFQCRHRYMGHMVAIKSYHTKNLLKNFDSAFLEARTLSNLNHPSFIHVIDCGYTDPEKNYPYMTMEYFEGRTLEEYIEQHGPLPIDATLELARQIAETMQVAHIKGILHRDLKPANILARNEENHWIIKLIDFGLALDLPAMQNEITNHSRGQSMMGSSIAGTFKFAPPEQTGEQPNVQPGPYSDIYSFGKTLCFLLFKTTRPTLGNWKTIGIDHPLAVLINECMEESHERRPQSFQVICERLKEKKIAIGEKEKPSVHPSKKGFPEEKKYDTGIQREKEITIPLPNLPSKAIPLEMLYIPAGEFMMGAPQPDSEKKDNKCPQHKVIISKPFYLGKYPITQAQWEAVMGNQPSYHKGTVNLPVEQVSWSDCLEYITRFNLMGKGTVRFPTEAEWEYACRAGTQTQFYWGEDPDYKEADQYAWYAENSDHDPHDVGKKRPNAWDLYDMSGNVWEWTSDFYGPYSNTTQIDPVGPSTGWTRVARGGSYFLHVESCRSARRENFLPGYQIALLKFRYDFIGFRLAMSITD